MYIGGCEILAGGNWTTAPEGVVLPYEGHGTGARENILCELAETLAWFDRYVKRTPDGSRSRP
jgi:hypothetical protein